MPNYLVQLPESATYGNLGEGATKMVIFAADAAGARRAAAGRFDGDGNALWSTLAIVTELVAGVDLIDAGDENWSAYARVTGGVAQTLDPIIATANGRSRNQAQGNLGAVRLHLAEGLVINAQGASYAVDDILTFTGGTFSRAATARVTGVTTGNIDTLELVDPGEYTVLPSLTAMVSTNDGSGDDAATVDASQALSNSHEAIMAQMVTELAAFIDLTASIDMSEGGVGARLFTVATVGDDIGDATLEFEVRHNGTAETVLVGAIVDGGIAGAVLTAAIPASPIAPPRILTFK